MKSITVKVPVNIAVIKYWGKLDEVNILALNDSISTTLSTNQLCTYTTVTVSETFEKDQFWLNDKEIFIEGNKRLTNCLKILRELSCLPESKLNLHISSVNNFPTGAGLASSASGYASICYSVGTLLGITDLKELSIISRFGSGSACRSLFGGFVQWISSANSNESYAKQIVDESYWPNLRVVILIVDDKEKDISSTKGMQLTVETSTLFEHRIKNIVPKRIPEIIEAIKKKRL